MNGALLTLGQAILTLGQAILMLGQAAAVAWAAFALSRRLLPEESAARYAAALALAAGYATGFVLLHSWAELSPTRHWHWTPWLALLAATMGPIAAAGGLRRGERWLLLGWTAIAAAYLLVPDWPKLWPHRAVLAPLLAVYLLLLGALLDALSPRFSPRTWLAYLSLAAAGVAALVAAFVSLSFAKTAAIAAAALAGCCIATIGSKPAALPGLGVAYAVIVGGWAFIGCIQPTRPLWGLLLAPAAPLALCCCLWGPLSTTRGLAAVGIRTALVLLVLVAAAVLCEFSQAR